MYNTCFWALVDQAGMTAQEANKELSVSLAFRVSSSTDTFLALKRAPSRVRSKSFSFLALESTTTTCRRCFARARCLSGRMNRHQYQPRPRRSLQQPRYAFNNPIPLPLTLQSPPVLTSPFFLVFDHLPLRRPLPSRFTSSPSNPRRPPTAEQKVGQEDCQDQAKGGGRA